MKNPIARYLMCAYAYYVEDDPLISDSEFDQLGKDILQNYDNIEHMHKHLVTKKDLEAGTYLGEYPGLVKGAVRHYRNSM
jgi:NAD-dependent DNA ligase